MQTNTSSAVRHYQFVSANIAFTPKQFLTVSFLTYPHVQTTRNSHISKKSAETHTKSNSTCLLIVQVQTLSKSGVSTNVHNLNCWHPSGQHDWFLSTITFRYPPVEIWGCDERTQNWVADTKVTRSSCTSTVTRLGRFRCPSGRRPPMDELLKTWSSTRSRHEDGTSWSHLLPVLTRKLDRLRSVSSVDSFKINTHLPIKALMHGLSSSLT